MDISLCGLCVCALYMCGGGVAIVVKKMTLIIYILKYHSIILVVSSLERNYYENENSW